MKRKINLPSKQPKKSKQETQEFNIKNDIDKFKQELTSSDPLSVLKEFVQQCDSPDENAQKYVIENFKGGVNVLDIIDVLNNETKNIALASLVFSSVNIFVMAALNKAPNLKESTEKACKILLNGHIKSINIVLNNVGARQIKSVLNLLTGMMNLNPNLSNEILNNININKNLFHNFTKHSHDYSSSTRKSFLVFIITLLSCGDNTTIKMLVDDKVFLLNNIFHGLIYDDPNIIKLLFNTLTNNILENKSITKTKKMYIFKSNIVRSLFNLYNWKGPKNWTKNNAISEPKEINQDELNIVVENLNKFLLKLCGSYKHGIIFQDSTLGNSDNNCNSLLLTSLRDIHELCINDNCKKVMIKILKACPDLIKPVLISLKKNLEPYDSTTWFALMDFIKELLINQDFEITLRGCLTNLPINESLNTIHWLTSPLYILNKIDDILSNENLMIQIEGLNLFHICINRLEYFFKTLDLWKEFQPDFKNEIKNKLINNLKNNLPKNKTLDNLWNILLKDAQDKSNLILMNKLTNILIFYQRQCSAFGDIIDFSPFKLFNDVENLNSNQFNDLLDTIKLNIIKLIISIDIKYILNNENILHKTISLLFEIFSFNDLNLIRIAYNVLYDLFKTLDIFMGNESEIYLWILAFKQLSINNKDLATDILINSLKSENLNTITNLDNTNNCNNDVNLEEVDQFLDNLMETDNVEPEGILISNNINLSSLVISILEVIKEKEDFNSTKNWTIFFGILLLHRQKNEEKLIQIFNSYSQNVRSTFLKYLSNFKIMEYELLPLKKEFQLENNIVDYFFNSNEKEFVLDLNIDQNPFEAIHCLTLFQMSQFYFINFLKVDKLNDINITKFQFCLKAILNKLTTYCLAENDYKLLFECVEIFYKHPYIYENFSPFMFNNPKELFICEIFITLTEFFKQDKIISLSLQNYLIPYQQILIKDLTVQLNNNKNYTDKSLKIFKLFQFDIEKTIEILEILLSSQIQLLIREPNIQFSIWAQIFYHLWDLFLDYNEKESKPFKDEFFQKILIHYYELKQANLNMETFENLLIKYFSMFSHQLPTISEDLFKNIINSSNPILSIQLFNFLLKRDKNLYKPLNNLSIKHKIFKHQDFILQFLENFIENLSLFDKFIDVFYNSVSLDLKNTLINPKTTPPWFKDHYKIISKIIQMKKDNQYPSEIVNQFDKNITFMDHSHFMILKNYLLNNFKQEDISLLIKIIMQYTINSKNVDKIIENEELIQATLKNCTNLDELQDICIENNWKTFIKIILKNSLTKKLNDNSEKLLCSLIDFCCYLIKDQESNHSKIVFEMLSSHSEFLNIILSDCPIKKHIIKLILILIKKDKNILFQNHIPIYLGAYDASLSESDQLILQILQFYEKNNINFSYFLPCLWGETAAIYYSVKSGKYQNLDRQVDMLQVLNTLNLKKIQNTIKHFPLNRDLYEDKLDDSLCKDVYDPNFILPLFVNLLAPNSIVHTYKFIHSGGLALTLTYMSSDSHNTRAASYLVFSRFYSHLESSRNSQRKSLLIQFLDAIRLGIKNLSEEIENESMFTSKNPQLSSLVTIFFSRMSFFITDPLNPLYTPLCHFLVAKQSINLTILPEFFNLFFNLCINSGTERQWILNVLKDGLRDSKDLDICFNMKIFNTICCYYSSKLIDEESKILILEIVINMCRIPSGLHVLINTYGLLPFINIIINHTKLKEKHVEHLIYMLSTIKRVSNESTQINRDINGILFRNLNDLLTKIDSSINKDYLITFINTLTETIDSVSKMFFPIKEITPLLELCKSHVKQYIILKNKLNYGVQNTRYDLIANSVEDAFVLFLNKYFTL